MTNFIIDFENLSDKDLYQYCKTIGFNARKWHRRFIATIPEVAKRRLYKKYGYCSIHEFAGKMAGVSHKNTDEVLRVHEKFKELPKMKALIGEVGLSKLKVVACIATKDTDGFWAEKVKNMTKSSLEIYAREIKRKETEVEKIIYKPVLLPIKIQNIVQKFPGELIVENLKIPQAQGQTNMFNSKTFISQNTNESTCAEFENTKKTFTIQIDEETEFELRKFKQLLEKERKEPVDWNFAFKKMVKRAMSDHSNNVKTIGLKQIIKSERSRTTAKTESTSDLRTIPKEPIQNAKSEMTSEPSYKPVSRYISAKIKHNLDKNFNGHCGFHGCNKPAEQIHHKNGFSKTHNHKNLIPLCKTHHDFVHQSDAKPILSKINRIFNKFKSEKFADCG